MSYIFLINYIHAPVAFKHIWPDTYFVIYDIQHQCYGSFGYTNQVFFLQEETHLLPILDLWTTSEFCQIIRYYTDRPFH